MHPSTDMVAPSIGAAGASAPQVKSRLRFGVTPTFGDRADRRSAAPVLAPTSEAARAPLDRSATAIGGAAKRAVDVLGALALIGFLAPLLVVIALAVRFDSKGPALFRQTRIGLHGRPFSILKFPTMRVMEDGPVVTQATLGDPRVTRLGAFLRRTSLDELPQILNVLIGDMSLIGPRPHARAHDEHYRRLIPGYTARWQARPGMTGLAQVTGWRGPTPELRDMEGRIAQDVRYVEGWTLRLDVEIALRTLKVVWTGEAAI